MKPTKFLVLVGDSYYAEDHLLPDFKDRDRLISCETHMRIVTCAHSELQLNYVLAPLEDQEEIFLLRDINGNLFYFEEIWNKEEVINAFE